MVEAHPRTSCRRLFKNVEILPVPVNFFINNQNFQANLSIHNINTRNKYHLRRPTANLSCFQKNAFYSGIRIFNSLPRVLQILRMKRQSLK
jgi:hypothetical protein